VSWTYEIRNYSVEPHWHVSVQLTAGSRTETLVYAETEAEIVEWLKRSTIIEPFLFGAKFDPSATHSRHCVKNDCKPRPRRVGTLEEYLRHPAHGWWRRISLDDLV
jgi:hypothetical protein